MQKPTPDIPAIQKELRQRRLAGWLFCDFHGRDPIAYSVLGLGDGFASRRWFYLIPDSGAPRKLVHRIEAGMLDALPGVKSIYSGQDELWKALPRFLGRGKKLAMQYSPKNTIPYVSTVDAGTVELVRGMGKTVVSSAELVQLFEARWSAEQFETHLAAGRVIDRVIQQAFSQAGAHLRAGKTLTEFELQQWILEQYRANLIVTEDGPIVAAGPHTANPHYQPAMEGSRALAPGDLLLLDCWGKTRGAHSVYYDVTWMGYLGDKVPAKYARVFAVVREARDAAISFVQDAVQSGRTVRGWQVDQAARKVIHKAGLGRAFPHRTGHNIGRSVHGNGAHMDSVEMKDQRPVIPHTCFSIEPGIYLKEFGVRSEVNVYVADRQARVTGNVQTEILPILA